MDSIKYKLDGLSLIVSKEVQQELLCKNYVPGTQIGIEFFKLILENDDVFGYTVDVFSGKLKSFIVTVREENSFYDMSTAVAKLNIYEGLIQALRFEQIKLTDVTRKRIQKLKEMVDFDYFKKANSDQVINLDIEGQNYEIKCADIFSFVNMEPSKFEATIKDNNELFGIKKEYFLYAVDCYFKRKGLKKSYILLHYEAKNLDDIDKNRFADIQAINKYLRTKDTIYKDVVINPELKEHILSGLPADFTLLEKIMYVYIKLCKTLTYDTEFYAARQRGKAAEKHVDPAHIESITPENNQVVCFEFNTIFTKFLEEFGVNFSSSYVKSDEEAYGHGHVNVEFRVGKFVILADAVTSIFTGDLFAAKLNKQINGFICLNINPDTKMEFNQSLEKVRNYIENEERELNQERLKEESLEELLNEYKEYTDSLIEIPLRERLAVMFEKINSLKNIKGIDLFSYIMLLGKVAFTGSERNYNIKFEIIKNNETDEGIESLPLGIITVNPNGFSGNPWENTYYTCDCNGKFAPISFLTLVNKFESKAYEHINKNENNIPGLVLGRRALK